MTFDLHVVFNEKLMVDLQKLSIRMNKKSVSSTIVEVIKMLMPILEKFQIEFQNRKSEYKKIADSEEKRHNFHVYFPEDIYMKLKELHQYLNFYSMAQIVREILQLYLKDYIGNGVKDVMKKYDELKNNWNKWKMMRKGKDNIRQLYHNNPPLYSISVTYDVNYHPIIIKYLS